VKKILYLLLSLTFWSVAASAQYATPAVTTYRNYNKVNTNADGEQLILVITDSTPVTNNTTGSAPTPTTGALQEWDGSAFVAVTTDVSNANNGSMFPQFANDYFVQGYKTLLVNKSAPGSEYSPNGDNNNWSPSGTLYNDAITECDQALADQGLEVPIAIFLSIGINDARGAISLPTIRADMDLLFAKLSAKYPTTPILVAQVGSADASNPNNSRIADIRRHTKRIALTYENVCFAAELSSMRGAGYYGADMLHLNQNGLNEWGKMYARWFANADREKWARSIIACHFDDLSTGRKDLISAFVLTNTYASLDYFSNFHTTIKANTFVDWGFLGSPLDFGFDFVANDAITTNPTGTKGYVTGFIPSFTQLNISQTDISFGVKVKSNSTAAGTAAAAMSCTSTAQSIIEQTTTPSILYRNNDATLSQYTTQTSFQSDTYYEANRSGTTKALYINGTSVQSGTVASTGMTSDAFGIGCRHAGGSISQIINASFEYAIVYKTSGVSAATVYSDLETLRDGW